MAITTYDDLISREASGYKRVDPFFVQLQTTQTTTLIAGASQARTYYHTPLRALPTPLPSGVSKYAIKQITMTSNSVGTYYFGKLTLMGTLDISTNIFTDGAVAPTVTEGGVSRQIPSALLLVADTNLNATPGSLDITYIDQDNNVAETTTAAALTASATKGTAAVIQLNGNDWGSLDVTGMNRSLGTTPTGTLKLYHVIPLVCLCIPVGIEIYRQNFFTDDAILPTLAAGEQLYVICSSNTARAQAGIIEYVGLA